ncbi:M48 family metalloprotease [Hohaiivirga grylli]|uniref:M48 family metalloprotease n=1 Tax=Hohaiivirga grylli TaxID=3133970 RepID=UPI00387E927A
MFLKSRHQLSLGYSRHHEAEADRIGIRIAQDAGYDGAALARFFEYIEQEEKQDDTFSWYATHPSNLDRIKQIKSHAQQIK